MSDTIIVALLSLSGSFLGTFSGVNLIKYRLNELEKKMERKSEYINSIYQHDIEHEQRIKILEREVFENGND